MSDEKQSIVVAGMTEYLGVPGVRVEPRRLVFEREPTGQELAAVSGKLYGVHGQIKFLLGDLNCMVARRQVAEQKARGLVRVRNEEHAVQLELEALGNLADLMNQPRDEVINMQRTMAFFPHAGRDYALSFEHYREAFANADGDALRANAWMQMAEDKQWNVAAFRAFIRKEIAKAGSIDAQTGEVGEEERAYDIKHDEFALWALKRVREVESLGVAERRLRYEALRPVEAYIQALKA